VSAVLVTGEAGSEPTYCNPGMGAHTPNGCEAGKSIDPVSDVRPLRWSARVVFKELLDPDIETIDGVGDGHIEGNDPFTVTCGDKPVAYEGFYDPSGNHETTPIGPALVISAVAQPAAPAATACRIAINPDKIHDKDGNAAPTDVAFAFTLAPLHARASAPEAGATNVDPTAVVTVTLNSNVDAATLAGNVSITAGAVPVPAAASVSQNDPAIIMIDPGASLASGTTYTVTLNTGVHDTLGAPLSEAHTFTFTTAP
jgi:hypothetical protein